MTLWLMVPTYAPPLPQQYDTARGFVVRALTAIDARRIAAENAGDEGRDVWRDPERSTCVELRPEGPAGVLLRDFAYA